MKAIAFQRCGGAGVELRGLKSTRLADHVNIACRQSPRNLPQVTNTNRNVSLSLHIYIHSIPTKTEELYVKNDVQRLQTTARRSQITSL